MKKKVFRERYSLVEDKNAGTVKIPKIGIKDIKDYTKEAKEKKPTKRGKKNDKSNK